MSSMTLSLVQKRELLDQIASNPKIPSPPTVILRVLEEASSPDCTINDLCKIIQMDPGLAGKILRIVNSALFGLSRPATSIQRALSVVGVNSARLLVLAIALPEMNCEPVAAAAQKHWKSSISGAIVAHELSLRFRARDAEDDMAAGLLRDTGELVLRQVFPDAAREIAAMPEDAFSQNQCQVEETSYGVHHAEVSASILEGWRLPAEMTEAIRWHHSPNQGRYSTPKAESRAYALHFATCAAELLMRPDQPHVLQRLHEVARQRFQMDQADVLEFLGPLGEKASDFATLLRVDMGEAGDFARAIARAGEQLVQLSLSASIDTQRALEMTRRAESDAMRWQQEAAVDPLTKLFNRRYLDRKLEDFFDSARRIKSSFGVLYLDLDGFKPLNDRHGHAFGDAVLQKVAQCLTGLVRKDDTVARHGGDEFCIVAGAASELGLHKLGQRILDTFDNLTIRQGAAEGRVGASIGAVFCCPGSDWQSPEEILSGADRAMYLAKSRGKNRVVLLRSLKDMVAEPSVPTPPMAPAMQGSSL
jgi:diguanylate cyclase (GGDEF)-like protein